MEGGSVGGREKRRKTHMETTFHLIFFTGEVWL